MGNQPSSPTPSRPRSRSRSGTSLLGLAQPQKPVGGGSKPHRSLRKKNRSIELPDLDPSSVLVPGNSRRLSSHGLSVHGPSSSTHPTPSCSSPIPIGRFDPRSRTDSDAERLLGGEYGKHIPAEVIARANAVSPPPPSAAERRQQSRREREDRKIESLLAQVVGRNKQQYASSQTDDSSSQASQNVNDGYRKDPSPPPSRSPPHAPLGETFHSRLRFGLDRHVLMNSGILPRSETFEAALSSIATSEKPTQPFGDPSATVVDPDTGDVVTANLADDLRTTPIVIQYSEEPCEGVILCLYNSHVISLGLDANDIDLTEAALQGREAEGLFAMEKTTNASGTTVFSKTLNLSPGTHHMRFLVSVMASSSEQSIPTNLPISSASPARKSVFLAPKISSSLPTSPDPSGQLSNFVVVAAQNSLVAEAKDVLAPLEKPVIQIPEKLRYRLMEMDRGRGREAGHSFWSKDSEVDGDEDVPPSSHVDAGEGSDILDEQRRREEKTERWTDEIPEELQAAALEEEAYLNSFHLQEGGTSGSGSTQQISGFTPAPPLPPAPVIPRHLDKLILNFRPPNRRRDSSPTGSSASPTRGGHRATGSERDSTGRHRSSRLRDSAIAPVGEEETQHTIPATSSGTDVNATGLLSTTSNAAAALTSASSFLSSSSTTSPWKPLAAPDGRDSSQSHSSSSTSRQIDLASGTAFTDDASVLPVPSHVVLNHLSTSAIRNGVLAVGSTVRYKEKYLTAIYYKPA